jgi:hypothetical protein
MYVSVSFLFALTFVMPMNVLTTKKVGEAVAASPNTKAIAPFVASTCRVVGFRWRVASGLFLSDKI